MNFTPIPEQIEDLVQQAINAAQVAGDLPTLKDHTTLSAPIKVAKQSDYASAIAMASAKVFQMKPVDIATAVVKHLPTTGLVNKAEVAPPGFINFWLSADWIQSQVNAIIEAGEQVFTTDWGKGKRVMVEFVSANPTGPLHIGRSRGAVIGDAMARLFEACGWAVHREYYFNNGGRQMQLLGLTLQARYLQALGENTTIPDEGYQGEYLVEMGQRLAQEVGTAWRDNSWEPFKQYAENAIFELIRATLARLGVRFDLYFNELDLYDNGAVWNIHDQLKARGYTYEATVWEGATPEEVAKAASKDAEKAVWFRSTAFGDDQDRVIVRANGEPTYALPDIAYHVNKLERGFDRVVNVLGADHFTESPVVKRGLSALEYDADKVDVILHQMVHLIKDGKKVGMSTRKGEIITLDEIMDQTGPDPIRYFLLSRSTDNDIAFDLDLALKRSNENPVYYIQNAHVRCAGILRQLQERGYADDWDNDADLSQLGEEEIAFVMQMLSFPEHLQLAHDNLAPHQLAFWALDLARAFHPMYERIRVLHSDVPESVAKARLRVYRAAKVVFQRVLTLIGMSAPEQM